MGKYVIKVMGGLIILLGLYLGGHGINALRGWEHRNKEAFGISDRAPYVELAVALFGVAVGGWILFRRPKA
ncbi:MAG TPA: hypothetical protein VE262_11335 [Blastocatellia bacterium]|nr:hypothetical protein [Blastocatellia bacterium]